MRSRKQSKKKSLLKRLKEFTPEGKRRKKAIEKRRERTGSEKVVAACIVFILRRKLRELATEAATLERIEGNGETALTKFKIDVLETIGRSAKQQDKVATAISDSPSVMLLLEFLMSQEAGDRVVNQRLYYEEVVREACILVEGYQEGLRMGLDTSSHILEIPEKKLKALRLWATLAGNPQSDEELLALSEERQGAREEEQ